MPYSYTISTLNDGSALPNGTPSIAGWMTFKHDFVLANPGVTVMADNESCILYRKTESDGNTKITFLGLRVGPYRQWTFMTAAEVRHVVTDEELKEVVEYQDKHEKAMAFEARTRP